MLHSGECRPWESAQAPLRVEMMQKDTDDWAFCNEAVELFQLLS